MTAQDEWFTFTFDTGPFGYTGGERHLVIPVVGGGHGSLACSVWTADRSRLIHTASITRVISHDWDIPLPTDADVPDTIDGESRYRRTSHVAPIRTQEGAS